MGRPCRRVFVSDLALDSLKMETDDEKRSSTVLILLGMGVIYLCVQLELVIIPFILLAVWIFWWLLKNLLGG